MTTGDQLQARRFGDAILVEAAVVGRPTVVAFSAVNSNGFGFQDVLQDVEANKVFVRDPGDSWYQHGVSPEIASLPALAEALAGILAELRSPRTVSVGASMGGYASIAVGNLIGCDAVVACGPQTIIDNRLPHTPKADFSGTEFFDLASRLSPADLARRHVLFCGSVDFVDIFNISRIGWRNAAIYPVAGQDHLVTKLLTRTGDLARCIAALLQGEPWEPGVPVDPRGLDPVLTGLVRRYVEGQYLGAPTDPRRHALALRLLEPEWAGPSFALATVKAKAGAWSEAAAFAAKAAALAPKSVAFADFHAQVLVRAGRNEEAIEAFRRCLRLRPKNYSSLVTLAIVLAAAGRFEEALEQIDAAIEVRPRLTRAQDVRRDILARTVRLEPPEEAPAEDG